MRQHVVRLGVHGQRLARLAHALELRVGHVRLAPRKQLARLGRERRRLAPPSRVPGAPPEVDGSALAGAVDRTLLRAIFVQR